jgi:hypothetical protein
MDVLPLDIVGWLFTVCCGLALVAGTLLTIRAQTGGAEARRQLMLHLVDDFVLFTIWLIGLAGGIGVLIGKGWSRPVLELFCWALMVLIVMSAMKRYRVVPPPRLMLGLSLTLFIAPVIAVCIATILTLRGETALRVLTR